MDEQGSGVQQSFEIDADVLPAEAPRQESVAIVQTASRGDSFPDIPESAIPLAGMATGIIIACTAIVAGTMRQMARNRQFEQSRREIAAYVAEGSIRPEDAERLLIARPATENEEIVRRACPRT